MSRRPPRHLPEEDADERSEFVVSNAHATSQPSGDPGTALIKALATKAWQSNKIKSAMLMWLFGLFFMLWSPALHVTTPEVQSQYQQMVSQAVNGQAYEDAYAQLVVAEHEANAHKVWFWRFREPFASRVKAHQQVVRRYQQELDRLDQLRHAKLQQAKQFVGIWSDLGLQEMRNRFWEAFDKGKMFAQQQTFYHMLFGLLSGKEDEFLSTLIHWLVVALVNFTTGLIGALFYFLVSLIAMVFSYNPDPISGVAFFALGMIGAISVVAGYLLAMYGMAASGAYVFGKVIVRQALEQDQQRQRIHDQYQHYQRQHQH